MADPVVLERFLMISCGWRSPHPEQVAEVIAHWYDSQAADGFNVM